MNMTSNPFEFVAGQQDSGTRIDLFLVSRIDGFSRSAVQKLLENGNITCNDVTVGKNYKLRCGDRVAVFVPEQKQTALIPQDIPLEIIYEDDDLLVVNKPKGMVVHPAAGNEENTLVNALLFHCGEHLSRINGEIRPGILHRIDKNTSGLLAVAKNDAAHLFLAEQIQAHRFTREYRAVVYGVVKQDSGVWNAPLGRSRSDRKKIAVNGENPREAVTHYEVLQRFPRFTYMKFLLETGRTHQIRVHCAYAGHPVAGDDVYGPKKCFTELQGQCLHAKKLGFIHPATQAYMEFDSELPAYFQKFLLKAEKIT
ncbi:MAG: RluA family pseudouridine synthase [Clostridiales bacterium]|nr:RluA family pseudouridine synthase [Clostridiales bacterium]